MNRATKFLKSRFLGKGAQWEMGRRKVILINQDFCDPDSICGYNQAIIEKKFEIGSQNSKLLYILKFFTHKFYGPLLPKI